MDVVEEAVAEDGTRFRVGLEVDTDCENPRDWETTFGCIVHINDSTHTVPQEGPLASVLTEACIRLPFQTVARWLRMFHDAAVVLPLYYRAIEAGYTTDTPDVGNYWGVVYVTKKRAKEAGANPFDDEAQSILDSEVEAYGEWAEGYVFGAVVESADEYDDWTHVDGTWGLLGEEYARDEAKTMLESAVSDHDSNVGA